MEERDPLLDDPRQDLVGLVRVRRDADRCTRGQRREDLPQHGIEGDALEEGDAVPGPDGEPLALPGNELAESLMGSKDPLRDSGRTRGEVDVGRSTRGRQAGDGTVPIRWISGGNVRDS